VHFICSLSIGVILILFGLIQINKTYAKVEQQEEMYISSFVPFYWMIMLIGGVIIVTLSYVSWRKYKGQKQEQKKRLK